jgi:hypothetical protein
MKLLVTCLTNVVISGFGVAAFAQAPPPPPPMKPGTQQPAVQPGQQPAAVPCPQLVVQGPGRSVRDGEQISFAANIGGGDPNVQPVFNWSISSGTIVNGQGTRTIQVDSTGAGNDRQITADLLIGGYSFECRNSATATVPVAAPAKKVDEFGDLPAQDESGKLDSIVNYLNQAPDRIYVIGYAGRNNVRGYASDVLRRMKAYTTGKAPADRVVMIDGGFREQPAYEIWVVPIGAEPPRPSPTIDRKDIVYPKPPPRTPVKKP